MTPTATPRSSPARAPRWRSDAFPWNEIRAVYEGTDLPLDMLAAVYGIAVHHIYPRAIRGGWMPRRRRWALEAKARRSGAPAASLPGPDRAVLVERMFAAVARQIDEIGRRSEDGTIGIDEKDARTLATLARTLELLMTLEKSGAPAPADEGRGDIDDFRRQLARRIEALRHGD